MKQKLLIVTSNSMKFKEISSKLSELFDCEQRDWGEPEIQGTPEEIIKHKLNQAYQAFKLPVLVDDVSLHFEELNGFPGPYIKDFLRCFTIHQTGMKFAGGGVKAVCWLGFYNGTGEALVVSGVVNGKVVIPKDEKHQDRHFDIFFQVAGMDKPMIEFSPEEKNKFSHRGKAMDRLIEILKK